MKIPIISRTIAFEERATVNPQVSLVDVTPEAGIPGDVVTYRQKAYCVCAIS